MTERRASRGSNKNDVPSAATRRALNAWMLGTFGDGITVPCAFCGRQLLYASHGAREANLERATLEARRIARNARARERRAAARQRGQDATEAPGAGTGAIGA